VKRITLLLPAAVALCFALGILLEWGGSDSDLPSFTPARPPEFGVLAAPGGTASLHGRVLDPEGEPVADASVYLRSGDVPHWTYTDESGVFRLDQLAEEPTTAAVLAWGFPPSEFEVRASDRAVTLTLPARSDDVPGLPNVERADLRGRVVHPLGLERAYEVVLLPADPPDLLQGPVAVRTLTDELGRFEFPDLALGRYRTLVLPAWAEGGSWPDLVAPEAPLLEHRRDDEPLDLPLAAGALTGRLRDPSDLPIEGALVLLSPAGDPRRVWPPALSGADGSFHVDDLPAGDYVIEMRAGQGVLTGTPVHVEAGRSAELPLATLRIREDRAAGG